MTKISALTEDTTPSVRDILPDIKDPAGTPLNRHVRIGTILGLAGNTYLSAATLAGATSATVTGLSSWAATNMVWGVFDPGTIECEFRRLTVSGNSISWSSGLAYAHAANDPVLILPTADLNLKWFGAKGDGSTDDRVAINRAVTQLTAGSILHCPAGTYRVRPAGSNPQMINLSSKTDIIIQGDGPETVFEHDPTFNWLASQPDAHMFLCVGSQRITFRDFKIDGQWDEIALVNPTLNEQVHGIYISGPAVYGQSAGNAGDITVDNVWFYNIRGDSYYLIGDSDYTPDTIRFVNCNHDSNGRSGGAHQSCKNLWVVNNTFRNISDQDLDFEITSARPFDSIYIIGNRFYHTTATLSVALTGYDNTNRMTNAHFKDNIMDGGGFVTRYIQDLHIEGNSFIGPAADNRVFSLSFGCTDVIIKGNYIECNHADEGALRVDVLTTGTSRNILIEGNIVKQNANAAGISVFNYLSGVKIVNNDVTMAGNGIGIDVGVDPAIGTVYDYTIDGNSIKNSGSTAAIRLRCGNNATNEINTASICNNKIYDTQGTPTQIVGIYLDSNTNTNFIENQSLVIMGNVFGRGVTSPIVNQANVSPICIGGLGANNGGAFGIAQWLCVGTPEGAVTGRIGSTAVRSDGGTNTTLYAKTSGTGNTGWAAVTV